MMCRLIFNIVLFGLLKALFVLCGADIPCVGPVIWADVLALIFGPILVYVLIRLLINATFAPHQKQEWYRLREAYERQLDYVAEIVARHLLEL